MSEFLKLAYELLGLIVYNIGNFFKTIGQAFAQLFFFAFKDYADIFISYVSGFNLFQRVLAIVLVVILVSILAFIVWRIIVAIARYIESRKVKIDQDTLLNEIGELNQQVTDLVNEKNKIMAMKVSQLGLSPGEEIDPNEVEKDKKKKKKETEGRFAKLALVDEKYEDYEEPDFSCNMTLPELVDGYRNFACSRLKLFYTKDIIRYFFAGMATSKILILEGISGTGKTSLPYSLSRYFQNSATLVSVQPSFRDRTELLGYFNEFTKRFNETEFLRSVYEANYRQEPSLIVLDEMNLARIEYYFAEMLSVLEMPSADEWNIDLVPTAWDNDPTLMFDGKLRVPTSLWFVGTANNDDSTFTITDKVYDRAIPIEINTKGEPFEAPDTPPVHVSATYLESLFEEARQTYALSDAMSAKLKKFDAYIMTRFKLAFGNRIEKQMHLFIPAFVGCGGTETEALDYLISRKILKKFESLNIAYVRDEIKELIVFMEKTFGKNALPRSKEYLERIQSYF